MSKFILKVNGLEKEVYPKYNNSDLQKNIEADQQYMRSKWIELSFINDEFFYIFNSSITSLIEIEYFSVINGVELSILRGKFTKADCTIDITNESALVTPTTLDSYTKLTEGINVKQNIIGTVGATSGIKYDIPPILQIYSAGSNKITNIVGNTYWDREVSLVVDIDSEGVSLADFGFGNGVLQVFISGVGDGVNPDVTGEYFDVFFNNDSNVYQNGDYQIHSYGLNNDVYGDIVGNDFDDEIGFLSVFMPTSSLVEILDFNSIWSFPLSSGTYEAKYIGELDGWYYFKGDYQLGTVPPSFLTSGVITYVSGGSTTTAQTFTSLRVADREGFWRWAIYNTNTSQYVFIATPNESLVSLPTFQNGTIFTSLAGNGDQVKCLVNVVFSRYILKDLEEIDIQTGVGLITGVTVDLLEEDLLPKTENYNKSYPINLSSDFLSPSDLNSDEDQGYGIFSEDALHFPNKYFVRPSSNQIPINSEEWTEQSLWFNHTIQSLSIWELNRIEVTLNHAYSLKSVINALIKLSDGDISHDDSDFFYQLNELRGIRRDVYIVPKSNILTANYDKPASKAELSIKELFDALRVIYNAYYFVENDKLILEHLAYFENGKRYSGQNVGIDTTKILNTRANKNISNKVFSYEKFNLPEYQNYSWMDEVSDYFGSGSIQTLENYIDKGNIKDFNANLFTSDLTFIISNPAEIAKDGFVILETINKKVTYENDVQNGYLSFKYLLPNYHRHGMSGRNVIIGGESYQALSVLNSKKQEVTIPDTYSIDENRLILTELGLGKVKSVTRTIGDLQIKIEVLHETES